MPPADHDANAALRARFDEVHAQYTHLRDNVGELQRDLAGLLLLWRDAAHRPVELSESIVTAVAATEHVDAAGRARFRQLTV